MKCVLCGFLITLVWVVSFDIVESDVVVTPVEAIVTGVYKSNATLKWNFLMTRSSSITTFILKNTKNVVMVTGNATHQSVTGKGAQTYGNRISALVGNLSYHVVVTGLLYNDSLTHLLTVGYRDSGGNAYYKTAAVKLIVQGAPEIIGHLPSNFTFRSGETPSIDLQLRGNPRPVVQWKLGSNASIIKGEQSQKHYYNYTIQLPKLTAKDCGKTLTINMIGYSNVTMVIRIFILFNPGYINPIHLSKTSDNCIAVRWPLLQTGQCIVTYSLEFSDAHSYLKTVDLNVNSSKSTDHVYRTCDRELIKSKGVLVRGSYQGMAGINSFTILKEESVEKNSCWVKLAIVVVALSILPVIVTGLSCWKWKTSRKSVESYDGELTKSSDVHKLTEHDKLPTVV